MKDALTGTTKIRVRYQETDAMGVVYYANYLTWFEVARTEHLRTLGIIYTELEKKGYRLMVASVSCRYLCPARYDEEVTLETRITNIGRTSMKFEYEFFTGEKLITTGESVHVFTDISGKPVRMPEEISNLTADAA